MIIFILKELRIQIVHDIFYSSAQQHSANYLDLLLEWESGVFTPAPENGVVVNKQIGLSGLLLWGVFPATGPFMKNTQKVRNKFKNNRNMKVRKNMRNKFSPKSDHICGLTKQFGPNFDSKKSERFILILEQKSGQHILLWLEQEKNTPINNI